MNKQPPEPRAVFPDPEILDFTPIDPKIVRKGGTVHLHKTSIALFGWLGTAILSRTDYFIKEHRSKLILKNRRFWLKHSLDQWMEDFPGNSRSSVRRAIEQLEQVGVLLSYREPWHKFYSINYESWAYFLENPEALKKLREKLLK